MNENRVGFDREKLEAMTQARVGYVLRCYSDGVSVDWDVADERAADVARRLEVQRTTQALYEFGRATGAVMRTVAEALDAIFEGVGDGLSARDRGRCVTPLNEVN